MSGAVLGRRARLLSTVVAGGAALAISGVAVIGASDASFTATTANPGNSWSTGSIVLASLTDDDSGATPTTGTAMFSETGLQPGDTGENCIAVTSNKAGDLRLYASGVVDNALSRNLHLTIERGTGGGFGDCTGFAPVYGTSATTLQGMATSYDAAAPGAHIAEGERITYRIAYELSPSVDTTASNQSVTATFTWEVRG